MEEKKREIWFSVLLVFVSGFVFFALGVTAAWKWGFPKANVRVEYPVFYEAETTTTTKVFAGKVNINTATINELMQIEGIGAKTAQNIIEYRDEIGRYTFLEQLLDVDGIGEKKLDAWKPFLILDEITSTTATTSAVASTAETTTVTTAFSGVLNLNTATKEELMLISGIGEVTATKIIEYREAIGGFTSLEQLMDIEGIGEKKLADWSRYLTLDN